MKRKSKHIRYCTVIDQKIAIFLIGSTVDVNYIYAVASLKAETFKSIIHSLKKGQSYSKDFHHSPNQTPGIQI